MKRASLASRYRPQSFAEVVGQKLATTALSRAAAEDRAAPAYLLSGTRGVGKTTIARIFAKALNCANAPCAEPCNACGQCARITSGNHVDVNEIDAASNTGVDDVRALRENIGYAPMEGRYKIFIVDEAHMLSKSAFNALLKTLEEPPPRAVFIFATTEAHKFPATIISRCQHFVFRHLPEDEIFGHLCRILKLENVDFEEGAVRLIARRAQGSARDSLSLLDQVLAISQGRLDMASTREALGLAGQEFFSELFAALASRSFPRIIELCRQLLGSGADIGFFTRELAANARNLFLLSQAGEGILPSLDVSADEAAFLKKHAASFSAAHLHAAWQMILEAQRGITQNSEPGAALELLLLNLAMLPRLLPVGSAAFQQAARLQGAAACSEAAREEAAQTDVVSGAAPEAAAPFPSASGNVKKKITEWQAERQEPESPSNVEESPAPFPRQMEKGPEEEHEEPEEGLAPGQGEDWQEFRAFCQRRREAGQNAPSMDILRAVKARWLPGRLEIRAPAMLWERLEKQRAQFEEALGGYCRGRPPSLEFIKPGPVQSDQDLLESCSSLPEVLLCRRILGAALVECRKKSG